MAAAVPLDTSAERSVWGPRVAYGTITRLAPRGWRIIINQRVARAFGLYVSRSIVNLRAAILDAFPNRGRRNVLLFRGFFAQKSSLAMRARNRQTRQWLGNDGPRAIIGRQTYRRTPRIYFGSAVLRTAER